MNFIKLKMKIFDLKILRLQIRPNFSVFFFIKKFECIDHKELFKYN